MNDSIDCPRLEPFSTGSSKRMESVGLWGVDATVSALASGYSGFQPIPGSPEASLGPTPGKIRGLED